MGEMADVVDEERTTGTTRGRPAVDPRSEHEVVDDELAATIEQIEQARPAVRAFEPVVLVDPHHRQPAALCGQRVSRTGRCLFLRE